MKPTWSKDRRGGRGQRREAPPSNERHSEPEEGGSVRIYGIHAVEAVLANPLRAIKRLSLTDNAEKRLELGIATRGAKVRRMSPRDLDQLLGEDTVHQGALVETEPLAEPELADLCAAAERGGPLVVLDQVTDPHNVGAILRSCAVFAGAGLVMTRRHSPPLSGALAKTASGALEAVPVALVGNLAQSLAEMKENHVRLIGLDGDGEALLEGEGLSGAVALILGSEGRGLRRLTRELCDSLCRIGTKGAMSSLNVSNAAAVALYAVSSARSK